MNLPLSVLQPLSSLLLIAQIGLLGASRSNQELYEAVKAGDLVAVKKHLAADADVNAYYSHGESLFLRAIRNRRMAICKLLIERGADINHRDAYGYTPLMAASSDGPDAYLVKLLLTKGAAVNAQNMGMLSYDRGSTALHMAVRENAVSVVRMLLAHRAKVNIRNAKGRTALADARTDEVKQILRRAGGKL